MRSRYSSGAAPLVSFEASWSTSDPGIVSAEPLGVVGGRAAGQAVITADYRGNRASATVTVLEVDAIRVVGGANQGDFRPGSTVTMWLQGYYSVASVPSGRLSLRITDQNRVVTATEPTVVAKGGDIFLLMTTFAVPEESVEICRAAVLEVGAVTIVQPAKDAVLACVPVRR